MTLSSKIIVIPSKTFTKAYSSSAISDILAKVKLSYLLWNGRDMCKNHGGHGDAFTRPKCFTLAAQAALSLVPRPCPKEGEAKGLVYIEHLLELVSEF